MLMVVVGIRKIKKAKISAKPRITSILAAFCLVFCSNSFHSNCRLRAAFKNLFPSCHATPPAARQKIHPAQTE